MSNYKRLSKHPLTGEWEEADWIDNWFGPRQYGVRFSDGSFHKPEEVETKD
jgi:hypothetical protein